MNVALYVRVSTEEQTTENQLPALYDMAMRRGWTVVRVYRESESAWKAGHQKELQDLMVGAIRREFDIVMVWALDRLTRGGALAILELVHRMKGYGVQIISLQEPWTEAPGEIGEILYAIAGWVARMESERRSERTRAGLERARAQGKRLGRPEGSRDKNGRKKTGYKKRWILEAEAREKRAGK
jgi:DNA invertase Pin-like site-specific DNA recombinase